MEPYLQDPDVTLYHGDALAVLREMEAESVDCVVTSPPYWGLRDYGTPGQLGLEPTPVEYVERMVEVFREVRRVLAAHGTVWLNLGDSYASGTVGRNDAERLGEGLAGGHGGGTTAPRMGTHSARGSWGKPKDLVGIPWRVAFALQADGWYLRSDIIWSKPNPMPESVTDRPTKAHEYLFLLSKQPRYFFDTEAVREKATMKPQNRYTSGENWKNGGGPHRRPDGATDPTGRNIRSVWEIATQPYPEAHFATFPEELARRCIAAGCPEQVCGECGKARERVVEREIPVDPGRGDGSKLRDADGLSARAASTAKRQLGGNYQKQLDAAERLSTWSDCGHSDYRPGIVLDPFVGSGTTCFVARKLGRRSVGIDLSVEYLALAAKRLSQQSLFAQSETTATVDG